MKGYLIAAAVALVAAVAILGVLEVAKRRGVDPVGRLASMFDSRAPATVATVAA